MIIATIYAVFAMRHSAKCSTCISALKLHIKFVEYIYIHTQKKLRVRDMKEFAPGYRADRGQTQDLNRPG